MIIPVRLRLLRAKGFSLQAASRAINGLPAVNCARPGKLGNPFTIKDALDVGYLRGADERSQRSFVVECFRDWLDGSDKWWMGVESAKTRKALLNCLPSIRNHNLACWCPLPAPGEPDHCHAAVLLEIANR